MVQSETKVGLIESILLNLKMATEASLFMSATEAPPQPPPMRVHKMEAKANSDDHVSSSELQEMIDAAIRKHNRNASIISMCVGWVVLALFAEGLLRLVGAIPPLLPWLKITLNS